MGILFQFWQTSKPWSTVVVGEEDKGSYLIDCQTILAIILHKESLLLRHFIRTTAHPLN